MQLRWEHIDERVVRRVHAHMAEAASNAEEQTPNRAAASSAAQTTAAAGTVAHAAADERLEAVWSVFAASVAFFVVALYGTVCFHITGPIVTLALLGLPLGTAFATWLPSGIAARTVKAAPHPHAPALRGRISGQTEHLRQAFSHVAQTRAESLYGEVVLLLSQPASSTADETTAAMPSLIQTVRQKTRRPLLTSAAQHTPYVLLRECNTLLAHSFRLETEAKRISGLWKNGQAVAVVEAERFALLRKLDSETDALVKHSLLESVALCDERLEGVRAYPTLLARLDAHQEVVCQSLALVVAALARSQAAPHALHAPDVRHLRAALRDLTHQTRAVEDAVLELTGEPRL